MFSVANHNGLHIITKRVGAKQPIQAPVCQKRKKLGLVGRGEEPAMGLLVMHQWEKLVL